MQPDSIDRINSSNVPRSLLAYGIAGAFQGFLAIALLLNTRNSTAPGFWQAVSSARLWVAAGILLPTIAFLVLAICHAMKREKYMLWAASLQKRLSQPGSLAAVLTFSTLLLLAGGYFITVTPEISEPFTRSLLERLLPLSIWITGIASQTLLFLIAPHLSQGIANLFSRSKIFLLSLFLFSAILLVWSWVVQVVLPLESQVRGWNSLGVPILETQIFLAWACGLGLFFALIAIERPDLTKTLLQKIKPGHLDLMVVVLLWGTAVLLWQSVPLDASWFVTENRPPNFEPYPNSDAHYYDTPAQTALVGEGFYFYNTPFIRRPLYAAFLTALHVIGGQDYNQVAFLQILVLAFFPVLGYLVTRALHNRFSGLILAILLILRETNSIAISGNITASHVKLLMVDMPTTMLVSGFVLALLHWLKTINRSQIAALLTGGVLGACILLRAETFIFFFPVSLVALILVKSKKKQRQWLQQSLLFLWGILLVTAPWVWRNWDMTGQIFLDSPISRFDLVAQRYQPFYTGIQATAAPQQPTAAPTQTSPNPPAALPAPAEPGAAVSTPQPTTPASTPTAPPHPDQGSEENTFVKNVIQQTIAFIGEYPEQVALFIFSHFENSNLQTLLTLPVSFRPLDNLVGLAGHRSFDLFWSNCCGLQNYIRRLPFWHKWDGRLPLQSTLPLALNLVLISWGLQTAWRKNRWSGITPILLSITYLLLNALFRNSGGRYILPVDWIILVYFSIGLADLTTNLFGTLFKLKPPALLDASPLNAADPLSPPVEMPSGASHPQTLLRRRAFYALSLGLLFFGSLMPVTERAFEPRYSEARQAEMMATLLQSEIIEPGERANLEKLIANGAGVLSGRALYPRFFRENLGEPGSGNPFGPRPYPRIGFQLAGPITTPVLLPSQNKPVYFPHAADVLLVGCSNDDIFAVAVFEPGGSLKAFYQRSPLPLDLSCPFPLQDLAVNK